MSSLLCALRDASQTVYHWVSLNSRVFLSWLIHISPHQPVWTSWGCKQTGATLLPVSLIGATSAGENHILPETVALENWTWLQLLDMVVVLFHLQSVTHYLSVPGSFSSGCTSTLHQQHTPGVNVATFAVTIWQILPKSKRNVYSTCFCWHNTENSTVP